jgi:hypothetical protein
MVMGTHLNTGWLLKLLALKLHSTLWVRKVQNSEPMSSLFMENVPYLVEHFFKNVENFPKFFSTNKAFCQGNY